MAEGSGGMKAALRPLGAGLLGGGVAMAATTSGTPQVIGGVLALVGAGLVFAGGDAAPAPPPPPPPAPPPPALPPIPQPGAAPAGLAFGGAAQAGSSADFARADHVHALPALPPPAPLPAAGGDATGALGSLRVTGLQGQRVADAAPQDGQVLTYSAGAWSARALPVVPPPPPPVAAPVLPAPGGDLSGALDAARVVALHGVPLGGSAPAAGQVLGFDGAAWTAVDLPPPPVLPPPPPPAAAGDFVGRGEKLLRIVAAGELELKLHNGTVNVSTASGYGGLRAVVATPGSSRHEYLLVVQAADGANPAQDAYSVQLTPMRPTGSATVFTAGVQGAAINDGNGAVRFTAALSSPADLADGAHVLRVAVLLLRFAA
jgi:hypothetical protein